MLLRDPAPVLAETLSSPRDLSTVNGIAGVVWHDWQVRSRQAMSEKPLVPTLTGYSPYAITMQQALSGAGVLMDRQSLVQPDLDSGALVAPFAGAVPLGLSITAWMPPESTGNRAVNDLADALVRSAAEPLPGQAGNSRGRKAVLPDLGHPVDRQGHSVSGPGTACPSGPPSAVLV